MDLRKAAEQAARKYGVDPDVFLAQINQESGFNPNAVSPAGARGIGQFIPSTARAYGVNLNDGNPLDDLDGAARYMRDNLKRAGGDYRKALSIYNSGRPDGYLHYDETRNYVKTILGAAGHTPRSGGGSPRVAGTNEQATTSTAVNVPDLKAVRQQLLYGYLQDSHNPDALLNLAQGLNSLKAQEKALAQPQTSYGTPGVGQGLGSHSGAHKGPWRNDKLFELFYNGQGGVNVDNGQHVQQGFVEGHTDHVHVAAPTKKLLKLAGLAERMGLNVREFAPYDKVDPVHKPNSYHYSNRAMDVSGDPNLMRKFDRRVARRFGL